MNLEQWKISSSHCRKHMLVRGSLGCNIQHYQMHTSRKRTWKLWQELDILRVKVWAKEEQNFPSCDIWYTEKGNICMAFKDFDYLMSELTQLVLSFLTAGGWVKWMSKKRKWNRGQKKDTLWVNNFDSSWEQQRSYSLRRCYSQMLDKVIQLV